MPGGRGDAGGWRDAGLFRPSAKEPLIFSAGRLWDEAKNLSALEAVAPRLPFPVHVAGDALHPEGNAVATPDGKLSRYFFGIEYAPRDVKFALIESSAGRIGNAIDQLLLAGTAAMVVWWAAKPFLAAVSLDLALPVVGHVHLSTVLLFDIGVYMLVIGATVLMLVALAHQSLRRPRSASIVAADGTIQPQEGG